MARVMPMNHSLAVVTRAPRSMPLAVRDIRGGKWVQVRRFESLVLGSKMDGHGMGTESKELVEGYG
jgi:hypothetical protein